MTREEKTALLVKLGALTSHAQDMGRRAHWSEADHAKHSRLEEHIAHWVTGLANNAYAKGLADGNANRAV